MEFVLALVGSITAQKLRYIDLLSVEPWTIRIKADQGFPVTREDISVRVANAACFLAHKLLVLRQRRKGERPKDVLYLHDTLVLFGDSVEMLRTTWDAVRRSATPAIIRRIEDHLDDLLGFAATYAGDAAAISEAGRVGAPSEALLLQRCRYGLEHIFRRR